MRGCIAIAVLTLAGCHKQPSFDERYDKAQAEIHDKAAAIDAELAKQEKQQASSRSAASGAATGPAGGSPTR